MMMHHVCFRERANLQLANRRLERKVKEMMMQGEEENTSLQDQKDQVCDRTHPFSGLSLDLKPLLQLCHSQMVHTHLDPG